MMQSGRNLLRFRRSAVATAASSRNAAEATLDTSSDSHDDIKGSAPGSPSEDRKDVELGSDDSPELPSVSAANDGSAASVMEKQAGVAEMEAITCIWDKKALITVYVCMFMMYFVNAFQSSLTVGLSPYVVSGFEQHSLLPIITVVASSFNAALYFPVAKLSDIFGRSNAFASMVALATLGLILMASTRSIYEYCAAQVFYSVGFAGMTFSIDILTSSTSRISSRGVAFAFTSSPYMITAFAGPKAAEGFYESNWRWAFGAFAIILPVAASPLFLVLKYWERRAVKEGLNVKEESGRTLIESIRFYVIEFDLLGCFLLAAGLVIFLLPFSLADAAPNGWKTGYIIAMIVLGIVLLGLFAASQRFFSPKPFLPYRFLKDRTILGSCLLAFSYQVAYYAWASYFSSFLQVVSGLSISTAGYVSNTFDVVSGVWLFVVGILIKKTGYFKWLLFGAVPLYILAQGLMIYFRRPGFSVGWLVFCQVLMSFGGSTMIIVEQVAIMAGGLSHQNIAATLAMLSMMGWIGGSVGSTISGAIWTHTFPVALERYLPAESQEFLADIYGDLTVQLSHPKGDATRDAIELAYGYAQKRMLIAGTSFTALTLVSVFVIKNINVAKLSQTKGTLF